MQRNRRPRIVASTRSQDDEPTSARNRRITHHRNLRRGAGLAHEERPHHRAVCPRWRCRYARPPLRRGLKPGFRQAIRGREPPRRRRHPGGGGDRPHRARRLHPDDVGHSDHRGRPDHEQERRLRSDARPHPHRLFRRYAEHAHDAFIAWHQDLFRIHRLCAEATLRHRLCVGRSRHHGQLERRVPRDAREHQTQSHRLQRRLAGDRRSHRWPREGWAC